MNVRGRSRRALLAMLLASRSAWPEATEPPVVAPQRPERPVARAPVRPLPVTPRLLADTAAAALRAAGNADARRMLSSMAARTRSSALLPELWIRAARSTDDSLRLSPTLDDPYHYTALGGAGTWLEARLAWHFDRLLFDHDEIPVERLRREHSEAMAKLVGKVTTVLFAWQRALVRADDPKATEEEVEEAILAKAEAEATLDLMTAGWFGKVVLRSKPSGPAPAATDASGVGTAP